MPPLRRGIDLMPFQNLIEVYTLTIGSAGSFSGSVYLAGNGIIGIANRGTWTAAPLTLQTTMSGASPDAGGTWCSIYPSGAGSEWAIPAGTMANGTAYYPIPPSDLPALFWVRAVSGNAAGGTLQQAARSLDLITRPL